MIKKTNATEPQIPEEIWMLWVTHDECGNEETFPHWLTFRDSYVFAWCDSEEDAWRACVEQEESSGIKTRPVRVK